MCPNKSNSRCTLLAAGLALLQLTASVLADVSHLSPASGLEYTITPSAQVAYYQYPAPRVQHQRQQQQPQQPQHHQQVARQFAAPALEHAAFTQALTSSGYVFGANPPQLAAAAAPSAALTAASTGRAIATQASDSNSLNLKLPVPLGAMPLNVAHLPLQAGAPYALVPRTTGLTSYGTPHVQRR